MKELPTEAAFCKKPGAREAGWLTALLALLIVVRIPAILGPINLSQDATEYVDIARNVAHGSGLTLKIRAYFFGDGYKLPYPSATLRSPLFPFLMGKTFAVLPSPHVFQWFNFGLFIINMVLLALILGRVLPFRILLYSLLLVGLSEPMFLTSVFPWAEQTAFLWLLTAILLASIELHRHWGAVGALIEGLAAALAGLSRPEYMLVGLLCLVWLLSKRERRILWVGAFLLGFLAPLAGVSLMNLHAYGRFFLPGEYLFRSRQYDSYFSWDNAGARSVGEFIAANWVWIIPRVLRNLANYTAKLIGWRDLFVLAAGLPFVLRNAFSNVYDWRRQHLVITAAAFLGAYCLVWAGIDRERYLLAITPFWLPLCIMEVNRWRRLARKRWIRLACIGILAANLPLLLGYAIFADVRMASHARIGERFYANENPAWSNPDVQRLAWWIRNYVGMDEVLCLENPFLINFETGRPALLLPERIQPEELAAFLKYYGVRYWVNNTIFTKYQPASLAGLESAIRAAGADQAAHCGTYRIWRLP